MGQPYVMPGPGHTGNTCCSCTLSFIPGSSAGLEPPFLSTCCLPIWSWMLIWREECTTLHNDATAPIKPQNMMPARLFRVCFAWHVANCIPVQSCTCKLPPHAIFAQGRFLSKPVSSLSACFCIDPISREVYFTSQVCLRKKA